MGKFQESLKKYLEKFHNQETYFINDTRNLDLFRKNPRNTKVEDIHMKLSVIDDGEFNRLGDLNEMAKHILSLQIDPRIEKGDLAVVEEIASVKIRGNQHAFLQFASQYCNLHRPEMFPIYSDENLEFYRKYIKENNLKLNPGDIGKYLVFTTALKDLVERLGLNGKLNYLQIRKFAWLYAKDVLDESR